MILAFIAGFCADLAWLAWMYFAWRGWALCSALASMVIGAAGFFGLQRGLQGTGQTVCLILGYGAGSYVATMLKRMTKEKDAL